MSDDDTLHLTPAEVEQVEAMLTHDARDSRYWAAIRADQSRFTVDAVIRLAENEQADLRAEAERLRAALRFKNGTIEDLALVIETLRAQLDAGGLS